MHFRRSVRILLSIVCFGNVPWVSQGIAEQIEQTIHRAGNLESEAERFALLKQLAARDDLDAELRRELKLLLPQIDWWAHGREKANRYRSPGRDIRYLTDFFYLRGGFDDPKVSAAQVRLAEGIFAQPHLREGYTSAMSDVEHTSEDTTDTITPMMHLAPDDRHWRRRTLRIHELMRDVWTGRNERGQLQFKSTYFNVSRVDPNPQKACDTVYHGRVILPLLLYWNRTGDEQVGKLITDWMDTWVAVSMGGESGKPPGVIPSAFHWPDGRPGGFRTENWWEPKNYPGPLYEWPSAVVMIVNALLQTYQMTSDEKYLEPIRAMANLRLDYLKNPPTKTPEAGSASWCAAQLERILPDALAKYRFLTGRKEFDELLAADANGYVRMRLGQGRDQLARELDQNAAAFRINQFAYTSEMRWTDRVMVFNALWCNAVLKQDVPLPNLNLLYSTLTGDPGGAVNFPMNAVKWLTEPRAFAALVTETSPQSLTAELYHFRRRSEGFRSRIAPDQTGQVQTFHSNRRRRDAGFTFIHRRRPAHARSSQPSFAHALYACHHP